MLRVADEACIEHVQVMHKNWDYFKQNLRNYGGLWVGKFIKTHTYQHITKEASVEVGDYCSRLCGYENFAGHKEQADVRLRRWKPGYDTKYYTGESNQTLLSRMQGKSC